MDDLFYKNKSISSIRSLSAALGVPEEVLTYFQTNSKKYYRQNTPEVKENGKIRITYRVDDSLKAIHDKIKKNILQNVYYPEYIQGSIRSPESPRDYMSDAKIHSGRRVVVSEDVSDFFPSIKYDQVFKMWKYFFNFPDAVSKILTDLTTYNNFIPQGSKTSSYIANLIFWQHEPAIVKELNEKEILYSRYVDDITLSFDRYVPDDELRKIISKIFGMMLKTGIKPNREKQEIKSRKNNTTVHNLNVTTSFPTFSRKKRNNIRLAVFNCKKAYRKREVDFLTYKKMYQSARTKVGQLGRLHPEQAKRLKLELIDCKPRNFT